MQSGAGKEDEGKWRDAVIVALGGNIGGVWGSSAAIIERALDRLPEVGLKVLRRSSLWRSVAWPDPAEPEYINAVALVETDLGPAETLAALHRLERDFGRERGLPNAPRTLDLDLIAHGRAVIETEGLTLPHPRAAARYFVMGPLAEIAPDWRCPVGGRTARDLAADAPVGRDAEPVRS